MADHLSILGCGVLLICSLVESSCKPTCLKDLYLDEATGNCDHCSDICQHAVIQKTINKCHNKCPGYLVAVNERPCLSTQYYDEVVGRCEECDALCRHAQQTGQLEQCKKHCPEWTTANVYGTTFTSYNANGSTEPEGHASVGSHHNIPLIVLGSLAVVVTVVMLAIVIHKIRPELSRRITHRLTKAKCIKTGTQERGQAQEEMQRLSVPENERPSPPAPDLNT